MDMEMHQEAQPAEAAPPKKSRQLRYWLLGLIGLGLITLIIMACGVFFAYGYIRQAIRTTPLELSLTGETVIQNQIAFVGNDRDIWLVSPDGENLRRITSDGRGYSFPTWAPDDRRLAFIGPSQADTPSLYVSPVDNGQPDIVYDKPASAPFYLYWAPNGTSLTFLTQEVSGLALQLVDVANPEANRTMSEGAPFYWVWAPDSRQLLMHVGGSRAFSKEAHLSFLDNSADAERVELDLAPGQFQAPIWAPDGNNIYYIAAEEGIESIYRMQAATLERKAVTKLDGVAFMVLSPTDQHIAYLQFERGTRIPFGKPYLVDTDGSNQKLLAEFLIASMYWAPNGQKLALLGFTRSNEGPSAKVDGLAAPLPQEAQLRWWIYDVEAETLEPLTSFSPTTSFLQIVPFFDQYHLSLTFWSPDSRYFVVTKRENEEGNGTVWVYDTTEEEEARQVGQGTMAVWSWH